MHIFEGGRSLQFVQNSLIGQEFRREDIQKSKMSFSIHHQNFRQTNLPQKVRIFNITKFAIKQRRGQNTIKYTQNQ